jgi:hypothetical protein
MRGPCFRPVFMYTGNVGLPYKFFPRKSVLHVVARRYVFWPKSLSRTMFSPSFHVHGQHLVYTRNIGLPIHVFARKSVLHVVARSYVFWPKSLSRTMFSPSFHVHGQRRVTDARCCPKVRFTRGCPALRFLSKITVMDHVFSQFSCTRATLGVHVSCFRPVFRYTGNVGCTRAKSDYRYTFLPESPFYTLLPGATFFGQNHCRPPCFRPVFMYTAIVGCTRATSGQP